MTEITTRDFDRIVQGKPHDPRIIWTLPAIGKRVGRGRDFVRSLAAEPDSPIHRQGRQYFVIEDDLIDFMKRERRA